uniref:Uncharacterized protein n=1 Tax=Ornithorhynchus anatinus TaxID=9258 RepID=A0A6I8NFG5_ORNAN
MDPRGDCSFLNQVLGRELKITLVCGTFEGILQHVDPSRSIVLKKVKNVETGRSVPGVKMFFGHEIKNVEMLNEEDRGAARGTGTPDGSGDGSGPAEETHPAWKKQALVRRPGASANPEGTRLDRPRESERSQGPPTPAPLVPETAPLRPPYKYNPGEDGEVVAFTVIDQFQQRFSSAVSIYSFGRKDRALTVCRALSRALGRGGYNYKGTRSLPTTSSLPVEPPRATRGRSLPGPGPVPTRSSAEALIRATGCPARRRPRPPSAPPARGTARCKGHVKGVDHAGPVDGHAAARQVIPCGLHRPPRPAVFQVFRQAPSPGRTSRGGGSFVQSFTPDGPAPRGLPLITLLAVFGKRSLRAKRCTAHWRRCERNTSDKVPVPHGAHTRSRRENGYGIAILQRRKPRLEEAKRAARGHPAGKRRCRD